MKAIFGVASLLVVLALVAVLAGKQMKAVGGISSAAPAASSNADQTVREQAHNLQDKVRGDVVNALEQGARKDESDKR